jgi:hypothetical protein
MKSMTDKVWRCTDFIARAASWLCRSFDLVRRPGVYFICFLGDASLYSRQRILPNERTVSIHSIYPFEQTSAYTCPSEVTSAHRCVYAALPNQAMTTQMSPISARLLFLWKLCSSRCAWDRRAWNYGTPRGILPVHACSSWGI